MNPTTPIAISASTDTAATMNVLERPVRAWAASMNGVKA